MKAFVTKTKRHKDIIIYLCTPKIVRDTYLIITIAKRTSETDFPNDIFIIN